ncbi:Transcriptional activator flo8 [Pleurotus ostreatus]|uniref:Transcriptional activator flo8 n=1 Tax=Pleurotus ostreatus TaxID=5322 RepID=A0A8H6ZJ88_PLEOS|nr:Transcriptional activator flo8 [Pleurotus ostreatus]KAF7416026.1 Transcriptional activator flo8 [Pleurotus ostreatus]
MATVTQQQQSGPTPQPLQQQQPQQQQLKLNPSDPNPGAALSWEGDRMFNIYIYDYCHKRGFLKTAQELLSEADLPPDATPPINAKQGLLFEWWSVFWVLFTTKSNGNGPEDALLYTQHQNQQTAVRQQRLQAQAQAQGGLALHGVGQTVTTNGPPQPGPPGSATGPPMRTMNGMPRQGGPGAPSVGPGPPPNSGFLPNGMTNGTLPNGAPTPNFGNQGMPNGIVSSPGFAGMNPQRLPQGAPGVGVGPPGQRPNGMGGPPFQQSPTMANSPNSGPGGQSGQQGPGGQGGGPMQQGQPAAGQPMNQMGPGPHGMGGTMSRPGTSGGLPGGNPSGSMLPPNSGQPGGGPQPGMNMQGQGSTPGYRPPSRTNTPGSGGMMVQQSPSLMNRQVPGAPGQMGMGMSPGIMSPNNMGMSPGMPPNMGMGMGMPLQAVLAEFAQIQPLLLKQYKSEIGMPDTNQPLSDQDKMRIVGHHRAKRGQAGVNAAAGPSMMNRPPMQHPGQRPPGPPGPSGPQSGQRAGKRNSTSPGEEHGTLPGQK